MLFRRALARMLSGQHRVTVVDRLLGRVLREHEVPLDAASPSN
ncbi:MAG: hypothetical protein ACJ8AT_07750 [Hyalangium sp.]